MTNLLRIPQFLGQKIAILTFFIYVFFQFFGSKGCFFANLKKNFSDQSRPTGQKKVEKHILEGKNRFHTL